MAFRGSRLGDGPVLRGARGRDGSTGCPASGGTPAGMRVGVSSGRPGGREGRRAERIHVGEEQPR